MDTLIKDIRYALRSLINHPGFTAVAVITLALGIGANSAIFSVVNGVLLKPLNFAESDRVLAINELNPRQSPEPIQLSYPNLLEIQKQSKSFEEIAAYNVGSYVLSGGGDPSRIAGLAVTANIFALLRAKAAQGRILLPEDDRPGANRVVVVSHEFWQSHFGGDSLAGQSVTLDDQPYAIAGVMPADFQFPDRRMELWVPFGPDTEAPIFKKRSVHLLIGLGRLNQGVTQPQTETELATIFAGIQQQYPAEDPGHTVRLTHCVSGWWATSGRRCWCCSALWLLCCWLVAPTWPTCYLPAPPRAEKRGPSGWPLAPAVGASCASR